MSLSEIKQLEVQYCEQADDCDCVVAVVQMLLKSANENGSPVDSQKALRDRILERRGRSVEGRYTVPLQLPLVGWLLYPLDCVWRRHPGHPRLSWDALRREIDQHRPIVLNLSPPEQSSEPGHVVLMTGYAKNREEQYVLLYDPESDSDWEDQEGNRYDCTSKGRKLVPFSVLQKGPRLSLKALAVGLAYKWTATGLIRHHQHSRTRSESNGR